MLNPLMNHASLFISPNVNRVNGFQTDSRAHDMKSNDEIPFMKRFMAVIERTHYYVKELESPASKRKENAFLTRTSPDSILVHPHRWC